MDNSQLVSVIIPIYNVSPYIIEALDSVVHQTYKNLEIILIDDGSTDGSGQICDKYKQEDNRIIVIHQSNQGLSAARNTGLQIMTGEAVVFLDSDDAFHPSFVEMMMAARKENNADLVISKYTSIKTNKTMTNLQRNRGNAPTIEPGSYDRIGALCALIENRINHSVWNKLYSSNLWKNIRFPIEPVYEDVGTTYRILDICNKVSVIDNSLYFYRRRKDSITGIYSWRNLDFFAQTYSRFEKYVEENVGIIFSERQLMRCRRTKLFALLTYYSHLPGEKSKESSMKELEEEIKRIAEGIDDSNINIRVSYSMICYCPWLLRLLFPLCRKVWECFNVMKRARNCGG